MSLENSKPPVNQDVIQEFFENFDIKLALYILKKTKTFILIIGLICFIIPFLKIRYSTPIYETTASLIKKKEVKNEILGDKGTEAFRSNDEEKIGRDIQIVKSDYLLEKIFDSLGLNITYYRLGRFKINKFEFLPSANFKIKDDYDIHNKALLNTPIYIDFKDKQTFDVEYTKEGKNVLIKNNKLNHRFKSPDMSFYIESQSPELNSYQVVFNGREQVKSLIVNNVTVANSSPNILFNVKSANPAKSEQILSKVIKGFLEADLTENSEKVESALKYIEDHIDTLNRELRSSQMEKTNYSIANNIYAPSSQLSSAITEINQYKLKIEEANEKIYGLERIKNSVLNNEKIPFKLDENSESVDELGKLIVEKNKLLFDYNPTHPLIVHLNKEIAEKLNERVSITKASIQNEIALYQRKLNEVRTMQSEAKVELTNLPRKDMEYSKIEKEVHIKEKYVLDLFEKQIQYLIFRSSIGSDYLIIQPPKTNLEAISPKKSVLYGSGIISFLIFSFFILIIRYLYFDKIVSVDEVKRKTHVPILGYIPFIPEGQIQSNKDAKGAPESRLVIKNPKSSTSEVFKKMRASMKYTSGGDYKVIASTSTVSGEGKTFVLINLAGVHALLDKKVIILDLDLRKPRISKSFKLDNTHGMSNLLSNKDSVDSYIQKNIVLPNLDVITSGPIPPNPSELIVSERFTEILDELKEIYDYIFIDTPPVGLVNESIELINKADISLYLVRFNYSKKEFFNTINDIAKLKKGRPFYLVINHFGEGASSYLNYNYGGYSNSYGYSYGGKSYLENHSGYYTNDEKQADPTILEHFIKFFDWTL